MYLFNVQFKERSVYHGQKSSPYGTEPYLYI